MSNVSALPTSTNPASPQVQSKFRALEPLLAMVKINVTVLASLRRNWLIARVMPGRSAWSLEAITGAAAGWPPPAAVVVVVAWAASALADLRPTRLQPLASRATRTRTSGRRREREDDRHSLPADVRIWRISLSGG